MEFTVPLENFGTENLFFSKYEGKEGKNISRSNESWFCKEGIGENRAYWIGELNCKVISNFNIKQIYLNVYFSNRKCAYWPSSMFSTKLPM